MRKRKYNRVALLLGKEAEDKIREIVLSENNEYETMQEVLRKCIDLGLESKNL